MPRGFMVPLCGALRGQTHQAALGHCNHIVLVLFLNHAILMLRVRVGQSTKLGVPEMRQRCGRGAAKTGRVASPDHA